MDVVTVRIPELVAKTTDLKGEDRLPIWDSDIDKTRRVDLDTLRSYILSDGGSTIVPTQSGNTVIYVVGDADPGGTIASIPSLAGQTSFSLRRDGLPLLPETDPAVTDPDDPAFGEFTILVGGGFKLKQPGDELRLKQRYEITLAPAAGGSGSIGGGGGSGAPLIKGVKAITTNFTLTADHVNLLIQIRLGATPATLTLPKIEELPENTIIPIEAMINNTVYGRITTQEGQYIYYNNTSVNDASPIRFYIGPGELMWLYVGSDGFYMINGRGNWDQVGDIVPRYKAGLNEVFGDGSLVARSSVSRLFEFADSLPYSMVDDATWLGDIKYRGCFSRGDGSTTMRLPDLRNVALRGLNAFDGFTGDAERGFNHPGGYQADALKIHDHITQAKGLISAGGGNGYLNISNTPISGKILGGSGPAIFGTGADPDPTMRTGDAGDSSTETRMKNIGMLYVIKC
ncbi:MAG TPA: hypothetical protein VGM31_14230 [Puia sp.]|jgi:hypothetical protein